MTTELVPLNPSLVDVDRVVRDAFGRWVAARHARVDGFARANYTFVASLRLHRRALGADLLRAPANAALIAPYVAMQLAGMGLGRLARAAPAATSLRQAAAWLSERDPFLTTDVGRELIWRLYTEFLELPYDDGQRRSERDSLAMELLNDPWLGAVVDRLANELTLLRGSVAGRRRLQGIVAAYTGARNASADLLNAALMAGAGGALFHQLTPGALSLGPVLAGAIAHQTAIATFPLGASVGSAWYGLVGAAPQTALVAGVTGGLIAAAAVTAAFAGVVTDPVQQALGLHQRRLHKLVDTFGQILAGDDEAAFRVRDHYVARIFDLVDVTRAVLQLAR